MTLDADTEQIIRRQMNERGISFKEALNDAIRRGVADAAGREPFCTETAAMGESSVNLDRALQLVGELEDDELLRKLRSSS